MERWRNEERRKKGARKMMRRRAATDCACVLVLKNKHFNV